MPRHARIVLPGYIYHVTQRGNHRKRIFFHDSNRILYLDLLQNYSRKYGLDIFAYCLMNNHVHFIVRPSTRHAMARTFQVTHQCYAYHIHKRQDLCGHLWQGRFYSCLLAGPHLKRAVRYVENNPVRAKMAEWAGNYQWSSAKAHLAQKSATFPLSNLEEILQVDDWKQFLSEREDNRFVGLIRTCTLKERPLGNKAFVKDLEDRFRIRILRGKRGRPFNKK